MRLTNQQIFDRVAIALLTQGKKSLISSSICVCRGVGGLKCSVGHLILDEHYSPDVELIVLNDLFRYRSTEGNPLIVALEKSGVRRESWKLVGALQSVHDNCDPEEWPEQLSRVAAEAALDPTTLDQFLREREEHA